MWSRESIQAAVKNHIQELGRIPKSKEWDELKLQPSRATIKKHFNMNFNEFLTFLGYIPHNPSPNRYTDDELIQWLQRFYEEFHTKPTADGFRNVKQLGFPDPINYQRRFGSWDNALIAAGYSSNKLYDADFLKSEIRRFIREHGRPPTQNELHYAKGYPCKKAYKRVFGGVNECLLQMGIEPSACNIKNAFSTKTVAVDGHICDSAEEALIDDFLSAHNIRHTRNVCYPKHPELNKSGLRRCDFVVGIGSSDTIVYIEYAGLISKAYYRKKLDEKQRLAQLLGLRLIVILPSQLGQIDSILNPKTLLQAV